MQQRHACRQEMCHTRNKSNTTHTTRAMSHTQAIRCCRNTAASPHTSPTTPPTLTHPTSTSHPPPPPLPPPVSSNIRLLPQRPRILRLHSRLCLRRRRLQIQTHPARDAGLWGVGHNRVLRCCNQRVCARRQADGSVQCVQRGETEVQVRLLPVASWRPHVIAVTFTCFEHVGV